MNHIAIIPARGGSKRIPRKNIKPFRGLPMIAYAINAALDSGRFDRVVVTTDDEEIAEVARKHGAEIPFLRPPELADDETGTLPVIQDAIRKLGMDEFSSNVVACIYPTVPLLGGDTLALAFDNIQASKAASFLISALPFECPVQRGFYFSDENGLEMLFPDMYSCRSQDLPVVYHDAGQFYMGRPSAWLTSERIYLKNSKLWIIDRAHCCDIDTLDDWLDAERKADMLFGSANTLSKYIPKS